MNSISLIPAPKQITEEPGFFHTTHCAIAVADGTDPRVVRMAARVQAALSAADHTHHKLIGGPSAAVTVATDPALPSEGYRLQVSTDGITLRGGDAAGCFYGLQTLNQLIAQYADNLPALTVTDAPDLPYRGYYYDVTRGRIPTVAGVKKMVDTLAALKINSLQLYVEHTFDFAELQSLHHSEGDCFTAAELLEIDRYCRENFIDFIPSLSTFGHLYELLSLPEYRSLCELEDYRPAAHFWGERMAHHTIDPQNPKSFEVIRSLIDQYLPLFPSRYFNICCDETFDLGTGRNRGQDKGRLYTDFVNRIIEYVTAKGKTVMMWSDIVLQHADAIGSLPSDTVFLTWNYDRKPSLNGIDTLKQSGRPQIVCPGTSSWTRLIEDIRVSRPNIETMIRHGVAQGAIGALNTNWGDFGHPASFECALFGTALGAAVSWNTATAADASFEKAVSRLIYRANENVVPFLHALTESFGAANWGTFVTRSRQAVLDRLAGTTVDAHSAAAARGEALAHQLESVSMNPAVRAHWISVAKGAALFNRAAYLLRTDGAFDEWRAEAAAWLADYRTLWLVDNKESELSEIERFVAAIPDFA